MSLILNPRPPVAAVIIPDEAYESWIPSAAEQENLLKIKVKLQAGDGGAPEETAKFRFELGGVSRQRGICTNYPLDGDDHYDLTITKEDNPAMTILEPEFFEGTAGQAAETEEGLREAEVVIRCRDYGAYGVLKVYAHLENGDVVEAYVAGRPEQTALAIPLDENGNFIADQWEKEWNIYDRGYRPNLDEDMLPYGQRRHGDGYTIYEEYRGFMVLPRFGTQIEHRRLSPEWKDLFVYDPDHLIRDYFESPKAKAGTNPGGLNELDGNYDNPAKLNIHYLNPELMKFNGVARDPENRWVNFNSSDPDKMYAKQYALYVVNWPNLDNQGVGEANPYVLTDLENGYASTDASWHEKLKQPLKSIYIVKVCPSTVERWTRGVPDRDRVYQIILKSTVIHEVGHALGIRHHHDRGNETPEAVSSGYFDCAMRYNTDDELKHLKLLKENYIFCDATMTWQKPVVERDAEGNPVYTFQELPSHNCFGQIDVKSD